MSATAVRPFASSASCAASSPRSSICGVAPGTLLPTRAIASSIKRPDCRSHHARFARQRAAVADVIPAALSAAELPTAAWPSTRVSHTVGRNHRIQVGCRGEALVRPHLLVPATPGDPAGSGIGSGIRFQALSASPRANSCRSGRVAAAAGRAPGHRP